MAYTFGQASKAESQPQKGGGSAPVPKAGGYTFGKASKTPTVVQDVAQPEKKEGLLNSIAKGIAKPVATLAARPYQLAKALTGASEEEQAVNLPWLGKIETSRSGEDVYKDVGRAAQTVALGLGPVSGGAAFGAGSAVEQGKGLGEAALYGAGGAVAGRAAEKVLPAILGGAAKVLPKGVTNTVAKGAEAVGKVLEPVGEFAAKTKIMPDAASQAINRGAQAAETVATKGADAIIKPITFIPKKGVNALMSSVNPQAEDALTRAIKPGKNNKNWKRDLNEVLPHLRETSELSGKPIKNVEDLVDAVVSTKKRVWKSFSDLMGPVENAKLDGNSIADAMEATIDRRFRSQNPRAVEKIMETANSYRRKLTVDEAEEFLQSVNNELSSYYAKSKVGQDVARRDPSTGYLVAEAEALRDVLYKKIGELTGKDGGQLKRVYGALSNLEKETRGRALVSARQNPNSLQEQLSFAQGIGKIGKSVANLEFGTALEGGLQMVGGRYLKNLGTTDSLIERAFQEYAKRPPVSTALRNFPGAAQGPFLQLPPGRPGPLVNQGRAIPVMPPGSKEYIGPETVVGGYSAKGGKPGTAFPPQPKETSGLPAKIPGQDYTPARGIKLPKESQSAFEKRQIAAAQKPRDFIREQQLKSETLTQRSSKAALAGEREASRLVDKKIIDQLSDLFPENAQPDTVVTVYRAGSGDIKPGDYVTVNKANADRYSGLRKGSKVYETKVKIKDLIKGDGLRSEFFYAPKKS